MTDVLVDLQLEEAWIAMVACTGGHELDAVPLDDLAGAANRDVVAAMLSLRSRDEPIDTVAIRVELKRSGRFASIGDERLLAICGMPSTSSPFAAKRLRELAALRRARAAGLRAVELATAGKLTESRSTMQQASLDASGGEDDPILDFRTVVIQTAEEFDRIARGEGEGLELGIHSVVDAALTALPSEGDCVIIAARPGVGKSTVIDRSVLALARRGVPVGKVSVEDGAMDFGAKALGALGNVNPSHFWRGAPSSDDWIRLQRAGGEHDTLPIYFARIKSNALEGVVSRMSVMARTHGCKVIAVDYVQRIRGGQGRDTREQINDVISTLVATARQLGVVLLLVSQLKRPDGGSPFKEPSEIDLKESGSLEEVAQGLVLLWRKTDNRADSAYGLLFGKVAKVKRGEAGQRFLLARDRRSGQLLERDFGVDDA